MWSNNRGTGTSSKAFVESKQPELSERPTYVPCDVIPHIRMCIWMDCLAGWCSLFSFWQCSFLVFAFSPTRQMKDLSQKQIYPKWMNAWWKYVISSSRPTDWSGWPASCCRPLVEVGTKCFYVKIQSAEKGMHFSPFGWCQFIRPNYRVLTRYRYPLIK